MTTNHIPPPSKTLDTSEPNNTLITINVAAQTPLKLTSSNYISWKMQFHTLFIGYDLLSYIDGSKSCPPATLHQNNMTIPNPNYIIWVRQDQLILNAIIGSLSPTIIPLIAQAKTSREAWNILADTYAKPSRGRIKHVKGHLKKITKGSKSVTKFLQAIKARVDELALLGAPLEAEDLTEKIDGLGDDYKALACAVQARDTSISFEELHEKLLNFEASLLPNKPEPSYFPASANPTSRNTIAWRPSNPSVNNTPWQPSNNNNNRSSSSNNDASMSNVGNRPFRPYLGYCQICKIQGHMHSPQQST